jgi:lipopolysaccharide export system ATP-binding protein
VAVAVDSVGGPADRAISLLAAEGLAALADRPARFLSGGERRRVEITRCLALSPKVLLLDEPFAGVDPAHVESLRQRIARFAADGLGIVLTDHQVHEALPLCTRAIVMEGGGVLRAGTPEAIAADPLVQERYLGARFRLR